MAYDVYEKSVESGQPIELYKFTAGATVWRYTSIEDQVTYSAFDYLPRQIDRTSPTLTSGERGRQQIEITLPKDDPIALRYIGIIPAERVEVEIIRFHRDDSPNGITIWTGRIASATFEKQGTVCRIYSVSSESALSRPIPGRKYQGLCNHVVYDGGCKLVKSSWKYTGNVSSETGRQIKVDGLSSKGSTWAKGGIVTFGGESRVIVDQIGGGDRITVQIAFPSSPVGSDVDVYAGCDHSLSQCKNKFSDNTINFGGFPYVPTRNPIGGTGL